MPKIRLRKIFSPDNKTFLLKVEKLFDNILSEESIVEWDPANLDLSDDTICALCKKVDCICTKYTCPCGKFAGICNWPQDEKCPCKNCFEAGISNCSCHKPLENINEDEVETLDDE